MKLLHDIAIADLKRPSIKGLLYAILSVLISFIIVEGLQYLISRWSNNDNNFDVSLVFLMACMFSAGRYGFLAGFISSILSFLLINYNYSPPYNSFKLEVLTDKLELGLFLGFSMIVAAFNSYQRARLNVLDRREQQVTDLYELTVKAIEPETKQETLNVLETEISRLLNAKATLHISNKGQIPSAPENLSAQNNRLFETCWQIAQPTGRVYRVTKNANWRFEPLRTPMGRIGVLAMQFEDNVIVTPDWNKLISGIAAQISSIIQRIELGRSIEENRLNKQRENMRSMLLSSVSHDLKTPLASIIGSLSVYHTMHDRLSVEKRRTLTETALEEAQRLDSFITNILDMNRLESGAIKLKEEWFNAHNMVTNVILRMAQRLENHPTTIKVTDDIEICGDISMTSLALQNILDNAVKYTPKDSPILIKIQQSADKSYGSVVIQDSGSGIPFAKQSAIFDKYTRLKRQDSQVAGTGLGLAITKTIMEKQGSNITVGSEQNANTSGAVFSLNFTNYKVTARSGA